MTRFRLTLQTLFLFLISFSGLSDAYAQEVLEFDHYIHDFGDILIDDGPRTCVFSYRNVADFPVVIHNIISSCGCTEPEWSKAPIRPGESGKVKVTFLNDQGAYPFSKVLTLYVSGTEKPVLLRIKGDVHRKKEPLSKLYKVRAGVFGFKESGIDAGQVVRGRSSEVTFSVANMSSSDAVLSFGKLPDGISFAVNPEKVPGGGVASVTLRVEGSESMSWGRNGCSLPVFADGRPSGGKLDLTWLVRPDYTALTVAEKLKAPLPVFRSSSFNIRGVSGSGTETAEFEFVNNGKSALEIYAHDVNRENVSVVYPDGAVAPGAGGKVTVSLDPGKFPEGETLVIVTLITNSASRPLVNLFVYLEKQ